jgi:hypothetical protein
LSKVDGVVFYGKRTHGGKNGGANRWKLTMYYRIQQKGFK